MEGEESNGVWEGLRERRGRERGVEKGRKSRGRGLEGW
jgi:hypothetical protein